MRQCTYAERGSIWFSTSHLKFSNINDNWFVYEKSIFDNLNVPKRIAKFREQMLINLTFNVMMVTISTAYKDLQYT